MFSGWINVITRLFLEQIWISVSESVELIQSFLTGVLTDICVLHTAIDAYNLGYQIEVVKPAVASIWPENHAFALGHFKNTLGAKLVDENLLEITE